MRTMQAKISVVLVVMMALFGHVARADEAVAAERARRHFEAGRALYHTGNYDEAISEFALGYDLAPKAEFLINIGLCQYRLGRLLPARENFRRFLRTAAPDNAQRGYAQEQLAEVEAAIAAVTPPPEAKVVAKPEAPKVVTPPPSPSLTLAPAADAARVTATPLASAHKKSWARRNWWVVPVAVVVAGGGAVGLGLGLSHNACSGSGVCIDAGSR